MRQCRFSRASAIASRDVFRARDVAKQLGIAKAYGSYEELLADREIDVIYIPLPNHLHVPWTIRAAEAGKHVLCEKPIACSARDVEELIRVRDRTGVKIGEAVMVRSHPRWIRATELVRRGRLGKLRTISGYFTIPLRDPNNIRYAAESGGGAILDLGCYQVSLARMLFGEEPRRVISALDRTPTGIDRLSSILLEFPSGHASFTCAFETAWSQRMTLIGTAARMEIDLPTNAPETHPMRLVIDNGTNPFGESAQIEEFSPVNQYTLQMDLFARSVLDGTPAPVPLEESLRNLRVLDALFRSADSGTWAEP